MPRPLLGLLTTLALLGAATPAFSLTIVPVFDSSITADPDGAAIQAAINAAIQAFQTNITDELTVTIKFVSDPNEGLGASQTSSSDYAYSDYLAKLKSKVTSANDALAVKGLPDSATEPVKGGSQINLTSALARLMGLSTEQPAGGDSTVTLNMAVQNFTRPGDPQKYDLQATVEHEIDEVLGFSSNLNDGKIICPVDLFRYDSNGQRTFTTNGDNAYFSLDGTTSLARFNQDPTGDYHDWWSAGGQLWSPPGTAPIAQVQDAFGATGGFQDLGSNELTVLDVIGYTLAGGTTITPPTTPAGPTLSLVSDEEGQITLSWPDAGGGFVLQESADLTTGSWAAAATGSANPAVIPATAARNFYRLYKPGSAAAAPAKTAPVDSATTTSPRIKRHVLRARQP